MNDDLLSDNLLQAEFMGKNKIVLDRLQSFRLSNRSSLSNRLSQHFKAKINRMLKQPSLEMHKLVSQESINDGNQQELVDHWLEMGRNAK